MSKNKPAFPVVGMSQMAQQPITAVFDSGMSLRDYFAAKAMQAIISKQPHMTTPEVSIGMDRLRQVANGAYMYADAMMSARNA